ncbi:putative secreted protein (Por secretion system target) [Dokdonia sp. Hel_I_63]|uniref:T9SS type A sorting domain-containing protein n=1 Tax=Dokdonia sp. Hel_I_63 TaxID=1249996 RepID=UPI00119C455E|nr:T9SS type A sorting domain-containing protein [Dokdonia sp. Hel_I_63]TVZ23640.1 putative secreted protein (Por secretion system target) [Dokdonia sp. Hel_I_63]
MKNLLLVAALSLGFSAHAQLFVKPTDANTASYVFVNDTFIYVENDVELESNRSLTATTDNGIPNIVLRNNAQILQGEGTISKNNKGTGEISIYQEGTVNNFDYNVWGSPVGLSRVEGGGGFAEPARGEGNGPFAFKSTNTAAQVLFKPTSVTLSNPAFAIGGYDGNQNSGSLNIASYWIWAYKSGENYGDWIHISNTQILEPGYGFTMKGIADTDNTTISTEVNQPENNPGSSQRYDFRGRPNSGDIQIAVGPDKQTQVGNPYPSALDLNHFLIKNSRGESEPNSYAYSYTSPYSGEVINKTIDRKRVTTGVAYFWDSDPLVGSHYLVDYKGGYGTYSPMGVIDGDGIYVNATFLTYDITGESTGPADTDGTSLSYDRRFSPVGQGFMVTGATNQDMNGTVPEDITFSNEQRVFVREGDNSDFRSAQSSNNDIISAHGVANYYENIGDLRKPSHIKFYAGINDTYSREMSIAFLDEATDGYDTAMDAQTISEIASDVGFKIDGKSNYVINAVPKDEYQWIPLSIKASGPTEFKFAVHYTEAFEYNDVFLVDMETEAYHSILGEEVLMMLEDGIYDDRFFIRFTTSEAQEEEEETTEEETTDNTDVADQTVDIAVNEQDPFIEESVLESFTIIQNNINNQLEIYNPNNIVVEDVTLFDLSGKKIFNEINLGGQSEYTFTTRNLATGIYVVKFTTRDGLTKGRKISIVN